MVRKITPQPKKSAFTMIELIFAIVIIAISVMSLPMVTQVTSKSIEESLVQEAIFAGSAELMEATTAYWDENSMEDIAISHLSRVINISNDCDADMLRPGHIPQPHHRRCLDDNTTSAQNSSGGTNFDLNDVAHTNSPMFVDATTAGATTASGSGYKKIYNSAVNVSMNGNIKNVSLVVSDTDGNVTILKMQVANIGEVDFFRRTF